MMKSLRESIRNSDFVNYRKQTLYNDRIKFSKSVRSKGVGEVPVVIDTVDNKYVNFIKPPIEMVVHLDNTVSQVLGQVKVIVLERQLKSGIINPSSDNMRLGFENGDISEPDTKIGDIYRIMRNEDDKILYLLLTEQRSVYDYIISIINYIYNNVYDYFWKK